MVLVEAGKLRRNPQLAALVQERLDQRRSPEQISRDLIQQVPDDPDMLAAPKTIYQAIYRTRTR